MAELKETAEVLNDLIQINNDRVAGYKKAIDELNAGDVDLKALFAEFITQSEVFRQELEEAVTSLGEEAETGTTASGKVYRVWMDIKAALSTKDRKAVLESCEFGEDAAQKAYKLATENEEISPSALSLITDQKAKLKAAHDQVKRLRDTEPA